MSIQIARNGQVLGCFDLQYVVNLLQAGQLIASDLYWYAGMPRWEPLHSMPELQRLFQPQPVANQLGYYLVQDGKTLGPCSFEQLAAGLQSDQLRGSDQVHRSDQQAWTTFAALSEFAPYLPHPTHIASPQPAQSPQPRTREVTTRSCGVCGGSGKSGVCPNCRGTGNERTWIDTPYTGISPIDEKIKNYANKNCSMCAGTGASECSRCGGSGRETVLA